jgi:hypothetical protein
MPKTLTIELPDEIYAVLEELAAERVRAFRNWERNG